MTRFGYTLMTEQNGPKDLVRYATVDAVRPYWKAGFTDIALLQVGGDSQEEFLKEAADPLLAALRSEGGR